MGFELEDPLIGAPIASTVTPSADTAQLSPARREVALEQQATDRQVDLVHRHGTAGARPRTHGKRFAREVRLRQLRFGERAGELSLGPEAVGIPEDVFLVVHGVEAAAYVGAGGDSVLVDGGRLGCFAPRDAWRRRMHA